ncbi:MAG: hypothetical protein HYZ58_18345 [Acidobacteria bacterium]|nr:hypothetical protein [Acidobacteriota bacterium]MBI3265091.1 hypothetical protein [Acidobacteriota bacterium]
METRSPDEPTSLGLDPRVAAAMAYLAWWVTGLIVLALERQNRFVRFHALQSTLALGALSLVGAGLWVASFASLVVTAWAFVFLMRLAQLVWLLGVTAWAVCLYQAASGRWFRLPVFGEMAERWA